MLSDAGGNDGVDPASGIALKLDDEASNPLPDSDGPLVTQAYTPANYAGSGDTFNLPAPRQSGKVTLSSFDGINPNGDWQLFIMDDSGSDSGSIANG